MDHSLRSLLTLGLLNTALILSSIHGLLPYKYNGVKRKLLSSHWAAAYCLAINIFMLTALCITIPYELRSLEVRFLREKPLNACISAVHKGFSLLTLCGTFIGNWTGRHALREIFDEFAFIDSNYFESRRNRGNSLESSYFANWLLVKCIVTALQISSNLYGKLGINPDPSLEYIALTLLVFVTKNVLLLIGNNFYIGILGLCHYQRQLNVELKVLMPRCTLFNTQTEREVEQTCLEYVTLWELHKRLCKLGQSMLTMYQWQLLMLVFSLFVGNIVAGFYFLVYWSGKVVPLEHFSVVLFPQIFLINIIDLYLSMSVCERLLNASQETLYNFNASIELSTSTTSTTATTKTETENLIRVFEIFTLQNVIFNFNFRICGMLKLNHQTGFNVVVATIMYLVVLVQFDYKNL